jgi:hypothetical protein
MLGNVFDSCGIDLCHVMSRDEYRLEREGLHLEFCCVLLGCPLSGQRGEGDVPYQDKGGRGL